MLNFQCRVSPHVWWNPHFLSLAGLSTVEEVATGVEHILADMIAKDPETLTYVKTLWECINACLTFPEILSIVTAILSRRLDRCEKSLVTIQSHVSKTALKEKELQKAPQNKTKDIDKFHLYFDFTCNVLRIQPHQVESSFICRSDKRPGNTFSSLRSINQTPVGQIWFFFFKLHKVGWQNLYLNSKQGSTRYIY